MRHMKIPETGKSPLVEPDNAPITCSFCGKPLDQRSFTAFTGTNFPHTAAICTACLKRYAVPDYLPLSLEMLSGMTTLKGSSDTKRIVVDICLRVLKRTSAIFFKEVSAQCPKTGVSLLKPKPIAMIGQEAELCGPLFQAACDEIGLFYIEATRSEVLDGRAFERLTEQANKETTWSEHGIIYCPGTYARPLALSTVVFGCRSESGFPSHIEKVVCP